jgi:hypothetical protein
MIHVYLARHAIAEDRDSAGWPDDSERPLTRRGFARFRSASAGRAPETPGGRGARRRFSSNRSAPSSPATRSEASECALD